MKSTKKTKKLVSQASAMTLLKKPETMIGIAVFVVVGIVLARTLNHSGIASSGELVSPAPDLMQESELVAAKPKASVLEKIDILADTNSGEVVTVGEGDTFWKLASKYCGSGLLATTLREANGFSVSQLLHEGDELRVVCD